MAPLRFVARDEYASQMGVTMSNERGHTKHQTTRRSQTRGTRSTCGRAHVAGQSKQRRLELPPKPAPRRASFHLTALAAALIGAIVCALALTPALAYAVTADTIVATTQRDAYAGGTCSHISGDTNGKGTGGYTGYASAWKLDDGSIAYCASSFAHGDVPAGTWATFTKGGRADATLSYIIAHGFPYTNTIGSASFADGDARLATAFAVWIYTGETLTVNSVTRPVYEAGERLVAEAQQNGAAEWDQNQYWFYDPEDSGLQSLIIAQETGSLTLVKSNANTSLTEGNLNYSLAGAEYEVFADEACTSCVGTLTTTSNGAANTIDKLKVGTYYVREKTASAGFALDTTTHSVGVAAKQTSTLEVSEFPQHNPFELVVAKLDRETNLASPLGAASLKGAEFTLRWNASSEQDGPSRAWVLRADENGRVSLDDAHKVSGDDFFYDGQGRVTLPLGTLTIEETKAPEGYHKLDGILSTQTIAPSGVTETLACLNAIDAAEQVIRGDIRFVKVDGQSMERLSGVPFRITSKTTGESHIAVTDENGHIDTRSSWTSHRTRTNASDAAVAEDGTLDESKLDPDAGVWFSGSKENTTTPDDELGALPYDSYSIEELRCSANEGRGLLTFGVVITRANTTLDLGSIDNGEPVGIGTTLTNPENGSHEVVAAESVTLVDEVSYQGVTPGTEYTVSGKLMVAETGEALLDAEGKEVCASTTFTPKSSSGSVDVEFTFDASKLAGSSLVAFERLEAAGKVIATHEDITDKGQTVTIVKPEEPGEPEGPEEPDNPETPATPSEPKVVQQTKKTTRIPQTGEDPSLIAASLTVGTGSLAAGLGIMRHKSRRHLR